MANNEELKRAVSLLQMSLQETWNSLEKGTLHRTMFHLGQLQGQSQVIADRIADLIDGSQPKC